MGQTAMAAYRTIIIKGDGEHGESVAFEAITPGSLLNFRAGDGKVDLNDNVTDIVPTIFAKENENFGQGIDTPYAAGENVEWVNPHRGSEIHALVPPAAPAIALYDKLIPGLNGTVVKAALGTNVNIIAMAMEAVNNSGGGSAARLLIRIL